MLENRTSHRPIGIALAAIVGLSWMANGASACSGMEKSQAACAVRCGCCSTAPTTPAPAPTDRATPGSIERSALAVIPIGGSCCVCEPEIPAVPEPTSGTIKPVRPDSDRSDQATFARPDAAFTGRSWPMGQGIPRPVRGQLYLLHSRLLI